MRTIRSCAGALVIALSAADALALPLSPLITYQGQIKQDGMPISGLTDLEFTLWDAAAAGAQVGPTQTKLNVDVVNGLFTAQLDFTPVAFTGDARWIQIRVRHPAGVDPYVLLSERQLITTAPYAQGLRLPLAQAVSGTSNLFSITNTGASGAAGVFVATNVGHVGPVLSATAAGTGTAFSASTPAGGTAISANSALGRAGNFNAGGSLSALQATNSGAGAAVSAINTGTGSAVFANGDLTFNDDEDGIIFNLTLAPSVPMISMFPLGTANAPRMVIAHSRNFSDYGLQYDDTTDEFHFLGNGLRAVSIDLTRPDTSPGGGGFLVLGSATGANIALDNNEIMARDNGAVATLALNADGGNVTMSQSSSSGSVGIGTSNPQGVLHVASGEDSEPSGGGILVLGFTNGGNLSLDGNEIVARNNGVAAPLYLNNDGGNVHMAVAGGGVTIGTTYVPPGVLLAVDGKIMCEEMEVQLSGDWPDFVFDEEYELIPLADLERSLAANKHLPGIPSAAHIEKNGINVGEMQGKLLQKVEELTLYMIETNKQLETLRSENAELRVRLAELEGGR